MNKPTDYQMWWMSWMETLNAPLRYSKGRYSIEGHEGFGAINKRSVNNAIKARWIDIHCPGGRKYRYPLTSAGRKALEELEG